MIFKEDNLTTTDRRGQCHRQCPALVQAFLQKKKLIPLFYGRYKADSIHFTF